MLFGEFAKCQAEAEYPELWQGLVGAWSPCLSPRGGTVLRDLSGRGNHGTLTNMDPATDWVTSGGKTALDYDGSDRIVLGAVNAATWTWISWVNTTSYNTSIRRIWGQASFQIDIAHNSTGVFAVYDGKWRTFGSAVTLNEWMMYAVTYDGTSLIAYRNAVQIGSAITGGRALSGVTRIGDYFGGAAGGDGEQHISQIDDTIVLYYASSQKTLNLRYSLGRGGWATPRRRRWNYVTAQTAIPYWVFGRKNARLIGGGVS